MGLETLASMCQQQAPQPAPQSGSGPANPPSAPPNQANAPAPPPATQMPNMYSVVISPTDPGFNVKADVRIEFLEDLYLQPLQWLPSYGPWYTALTERAMQRRTFPSPLKGKANFHNSTSQKLMKAILHVVTTATQDYYNDIRHLTDWNAALCLLNGYFCVRTSSVLPTTYSELIEHLEAKMFLLVTDLKQLSLTSSFSFIYGSSEETKSIAPLRKEARFSDAFFSAHKLFNLFQSVGLFPSAKDRAPFFQNQQDAVYVITNHIFGPDIPPFLAYQWNLRVGLIGLEILIIVYLCIDLVQIPLRDPNRRFDLKALLGNKAQSLPTVKPLSLFKKGQVFSFLVNNYVAPCLKHRPDASLSWLFPGVVLLALEAGQPVESLHLTPMVDLTGAQFSLILDLITEQFLHQNASKLLELKTKMRLQLEEGLNNILTKVSPLNFATNILGTHFGVGDSYDMLYFLVLGYIPTPMAVV